MQEQINNQRLSLTAIFNLVAPLDIIKTRLLARGRLDDTPQSIALRFKEYNLSTLPILDFFKQYEAPVYDIDANKNPLEVYNEILTKIKL